MAGQPLFRAHKLRLMPQIPRLHRGGIRLRRLVGNLGEGGFQPGMMQDDRRPLRRRKSALIQPEAQRSGEAFP